jgi:triosephosphate isomerase
MRKFLIAGNWKMNLNAGEGEDLAKEIVAHAGKQSTVNVCVCPPFTSIETVAKAVEGSSVNLGAQNMHNEASGAYTGEISAPMLRHFFCTHVILGHSERREYFNESDEFINQKVKTALASNLKPILCVGETLAQREADETFAVVKAQIQGGLAGIVPSQADGLVIAYEPVWAIGTGKTATPEMAQEVHAQIRKLLVEQLNTETANRIRILYGGSMKPGNAKELLAQEDIDGGLIGGASLKAGDFNEIIDAAISLSA